MVRLGAAQNRVIALGAELDGNGAKLVEEGFDFREIPVPLRGLAPVGDLWLFFKLWWLLVKIKPAVVHTFTIKPTIYGTLAAALAGVRRRVCTITGLGHAFTEGGRVVNIGAEMLYKLALRFAHVVFFQNADDRDLFVSRGLVAPGKVRLIAGSGIDLSRFSVEPFRIGLGHRPTRFLMLARLLREKGVNEFIEAAELLHNDGHDFEFVLVGAEDARNPTGLAGPELERLSRSPVSWLGPMDDVRPVLAEADVVVLPSYREGTPRSLLEAMAVGRPIITTDVPGCRQLVRDSHGILVQPRDSASLAAGMATIAATPEKIPDMGKRARRFVASEYDEQYVISQLLKSYEI